MWKFYKGVPKDKSNLAEILIDWENEKVYMYPGDKQIKEQDKLKKIRTYKPDKHGTLPLTQFGFSVREHILEIIEEYQEALKQFK